MIIMFSRTIGPIPVSVIVRERHVSTIGLTEIPIETGASVTDHAYVEPKRLELEFADAYAAATWNALVRFQESRIPFTIVSGLMIYSNMMIQELVADRDEQFSTVLRGTAALQEAIIVSTARTAGGGSKNAKPGSPAADTATNQRTSGTVTRGDQAAQTVPPAKNQSILSRAFSGGPAPIRDSGQGGAGGV